MGETDDIRIKLGLFISGFFAGLVSNVSGTINGSVLDLLVYFVKQLGVPIIIIAVIIAVVSIKTEELQEMVMMLSSAGTLFVIGFIIGLII